ncbi:transposase [Dolichospermum sp. ST_con]|nr:transposase [Dolichospermum sp. ST_con]MDD1417761.1 transposase [Dolichospermum sp. ST_sed1]MDD1424429.1 transposase [Dolichospermum sp. ST_sed9]MDD1432354.1 transposase [Dolichospermum sp. ST_sed6]MDD1443221.1 transposase [Dolichospermum sp. ST_sed3]MDD1449180.1 transposase [Dolichospermum sp. ST_sed8]MDD1453756.1 transposase [Dolichospermum sp. ST_sed7]MDD1462832.1 transposase [Dolichospermum sp. ST_sed2]MDD1465526.1 transposase [Dolichospermum sp. ST_sed5]MDD1474406.1 transposase [Do
MNSLKFKLYEHKRNRHLKRMINAAGVIYNHCIALHKRYYRMWGKHLNCAKLQSHIAKLRKRNSFWQSVGSQAVQDICQRIEKAYQLFFKHNKKGVRTPGFKKVRKYKSFTLKQAGYKFLGSNRVKIGNQVYQFWKSREIEGKIKTLTIKRTALGELFMVVVVDDKSESGIKSTTVKIAGFDFGLKTFLTGSDGTLIESPQFLKQSLNAIKKASRNHSNKVKGSNNRERARKNLVRKYEDVCNRRRDWFWNLAHQLTDKFDVLCFETLNLKGMQRLWGRKISDLAFGEFLQILEWVAKKKNKQVLYIDQWYPSSKTCSHCRQILEKLDLSVRQWRCPSCQSINGRDENAAINIQMVGASTIGLGNIRLATPAIAV